MILQIKPRGVEMQSHHETDTVIGHSLGGAVALSLEEIQQKKVITLMG